MCITPPHVYSHCRPAVCLDLVWFGDLSHTKGKVLYEYSGLNLKAAMWTAPSSSGERAFLVIISHTKQLLRNQHHRIGKASQSPFISIFGHVLRTNELGLNNKYCAHEPLNEGLMKEGLQFYERSFVILTSLLRCVPFSPGAWKRLRISNQTGMPELEA